MFGSRSIGGESHRVLYFRHLVRTGLQTLLSSVFTALNLTGMATGSKVLAAGSTSHSR